MDAKDFKFLVDQLNDVVRTTVIKVGLVNKNTESLFKDLPAADTPVGINGFELMTYEHLSDDHVLFFSSREDTQEFIQACEDAIRDSSETDPKAFVGAIIAVQKQRLIKRNTLIEKEISNVGPRS